MAEENSIKDECLDLNSLLSSEERDFLVRNNGDQVKIKDLRGKIVGLYFSASWLSSSRCFTRSLIEVYKELSSTGDFEVVFIPSETDEESFNGYFSEMPWLAVPFTDSASIEDLECATHRLVILDRDGKICTEEGLELVMEYEAEAYPFTVERINRLKEEEEAAKANQSLKSLLVSGSRDYVISGDEKKIPVSELEGKMVGIYFYVGDHKRSTKFTPELVDIYKKLKERGENFEIVLVYLDVDEDDEEEVKHDDEEGFKQALAQIPFFALPFKDKKIAKLARYFELRSFPRLVIIGPDGKTLNPDVCKLIDEHGVEAYPFTPERLAQLAEIEKAKLESSTLASVLVSWEKDFIIDKSGSKIPVSELEGKMVGIYFCVGYQEHSTRFTPKLVDIYKKLKERGENFEIVLVYFDEDDEEGFEQTLAQIPFFALPLKDRRSKKLARYFEVGYLPRLVIIEPDGKTLNPDVCKLIDEHGVEAYPFTPERLAQLAEIEKARLESLTLESVLVSGEKDFVIDKSGSKVPVSQLVGKHVLLYFSARWCPLSRTPKLIETYHEIKAKESEFEIIFVSSDGDQSSFDKYYSDMPWLALPFGDERKASLYRNFKFIPCLVAFGPEGKMVTTNARGIIEAFGADAFPFTEDHIKNLRDKRKKITKGAQRK